MTLQTETHNGNQRSSASEQLPLHQRIRSFRGADLHNLTDTLKSLARVQIAAILLGTVSIIALSAHQGTFTSAFASNYVVQLSCESNLANRLLSHSLRLLLSCSGNWKLLQTSLPRFSTLFITSILTFEAFKEEDLFVWHQGSVNLRRLVALLQLFWIISEVLFKSSFSPILLGTSPSIHSIYTQLCSVSQNISHNFLFFAAISPSLLLHPLGNLALRILPAATMVTLGSCFNFVANIHKRRRRRHNHHHLSSTSDSELMCLQSTSLTIQSPRSVSCPIETTSSLPKPSPVPPLGFPTTTVPLPLSPTDSWSSRSSGAIHSGLPSPTGHCQSPVRCNNGLDETSLQQSLHQHCNDIYLMQHTLDTKERMYFVHKKLRPIITKSMNNIPITNNGTYKPLLRTLMQESEARHAAAAVATGGENNSNNVATAAVYNDASCYGPPKSICSVTATITVVKPVKETESHATGGIPVANFPITSLPVHL